MTRTGGRRPPGTTRGERQLARSAAPSAPPYLTRRIPPYALLAEEGLAIIEHHADLLLEEIGFEIRGDEEALALWRSAGASVTDGCRVHVPGGLAREIVRRSAPREFVQHARNPARSVRIGGDATVFAPAYGSPFVSDLERGRRYGTLADFHNFVKLAYLSPWLHHSGGTVCEPVDVPVNKRHLDMVYAHMRYSDKPFMGSVTTASRASDSIEMCRILFGAGTVANSCVILGNVNVNSPLVLDGEASRVIRTYAAANQAPVCVPFILGGAMGPVTTAGALAQCFAEATSASPSRSSNGRARRRSSATSSPRCRCAVARRPSAPRSRRLLTSRSASSRAGSACRCAAAGTCAPRSCPTPRPPPRAPTRCGPRCLRVRISSCIRPAGSSRD
jgi:trimethylamine--corrinoid protein Co-methyltransferase